MSAREELAAVLAQQGWCCSPDDHANSDAPWEKLGDCSECDALRLRTADALLASPALADLIRLTKAEAASDAVELLRSMSAAWGGESAWLTTGTKVADLAAGVVEEWACETFAADPAATSKDGQPELQARLDAIAAYAGHPGNWGASDTRGRLIHDLATGVIDPTSRDWGDTNLKEQP